MIHIDAVYKLIELKDAKGNNPEFSFTYISKKAGEIIVCPRAVCTSSNFERRTIKVKFVQSQEIRSLRSVLLIEFNEQEVML